MAELHIIGQILHGTNFEEPNLFCKWSIQYGNCAFLSSCMNFDSESNMNICYQGANWKHVEGASEGQTATCRRKIDENPLCTFAHPIDCHLACRGIQGWPKLHLEVFAVNAANNCWPIG